MKFAFAGVFWGDLCPVEVAVVIAYLAVDGGGVKAVKCGVDGCIYIVDVDLVDIGAAARRIGALADNIVVDGGGDAFCDA